MRLKVSLMLFIFALWGATVSGQMLKNESDSLSYAFGVLFGKNLQAMGFPSVDATILVQTIQRVLENESSVVMTPEQANMYVNMQFMKMQQLKYEKNITAGHEFLENNKKAPGVVSRPSGLQYKVITAGSGATPAATDRVTVHYHGTLIDGTVFDSSVNRGQPATFPVNGVIQGWVEALQLMPVGSKWILYIPANLAYGERQQGNLIEPYSTLIFEVELLSINN